MGTIGFNIPTESLKMNSDIRLIEDLGPEMQAWLEQALLLDLQNYKVKGKQFQFDYSQIVQEGHVRTFRGKWLESVSDIQVTDVSGAPVAAGWMDFVDTSANPEIEPSVFWLFLTIYKKGEAIKVKKDAFLPEYLWNSFTDAQKDFVSSTNSRWLQRDPKVQAWKVKKG